MELQEVVIYSFNGSEGLAVKEKSAEYPFLSRKYPADAIIAPLSKQYLNSGKNTSISNSSFNLFLRRALAETPPATTNFFNPVFLSALFVFATNTSIALH